MTMDTRLTRLLGVEHPLVLGPFGGLSSVQLAAMVSERGGLGSFGLYGYGADRIRDTVRALRDGTPKPFLLNVWLPLDGEEPPALTADEFERYAAALRPFFDEAGVELPA